jgi:Papain family cysteine protease
MQFNPMIAALQTPSVNEAKRPDDQVNVSEPADVYMRHVAADRKVLADLGLIKSLVAPTVPDSYSLAAWQTPIRNQGNRGTCYTFASIAAMEAMYRRTFGLSLDLSEHYAFQLNKIGELYLDYMTNGLPHESNTSYWGGQGNSGSLNIICRYAVPLESEAPYLMQEDLERLRVDLGLPRMAGANDAEQEMIFRTLPQETIDTFEFDDRNVPTAARSRAIYQGTGYTPINFTISDIENAIASNHEVVLDITTNWRRNSDGVFQYEASPAEAAQGHTILIVGYDRRSNIFTFKNSWGSPDLDRMSYDCLTRIAGGACTLDGVVSPARGPQISSRWLGNWNSDHDGWRGKLTIRRFTDHRNSNAAAPTKIGNWYGPDGTRRDINGSFAENGLQSNYWMASNPDKVQPGLPVGQPFNIQNYSWESTSCAGITTWNGTRYGVILDRSAIAGSTGTSDRNNWIGSWAMDHDGWQGILTISGFADVEISLSRLTTVQASYIAADGTMSAVTGLLDTTNQHHLSLTIAFPGNNQQFEIYLFSWETDNAAGTTVGNGTTFGVRLHKNA